MSNIDHPMPCKLDREVNDPNFDSFGHIDFASALKDLIEGCNKPPYSIGLLGTWGTGKSSIKSLYCNDLISDTVRDTNGKLRKDKIKEITFNAWRYGGNGGNTNIKRALLRHVFIELGGNEESFQDQIYHTVIEKFSSELSHEKFLKKLKGHFLNTFYVALFSAFIIIGFFLLFNLLFPSNLPIATILTFFFIVFIFYFMKYYLNFQSAFEKFIENIRIKHPNTEIEQWESLLFAQIKKFHIENQKFEKIVIFVDDLDRLSPTEMVDGLDGIRTFMEIPPEKNGSALGMVFVISCDESRVAEAIRSRNENSDLPGAIRSEDDARRYLDRIFQFRLEIPPFPKYDMREFALAEIEKIYPQMIKEIEKTGVSKKSFINQLIPPFVSNPRNVIQLVNAFSQSWWIAKKRELKGTGTERCGGLLEGTITKYPKTLAIICVFKVNFPHFYDKLLRHPTLIKDYSQVIFDSNTIFENLDRYTQFLLHDYFSEESISPKKPKYTASQAPLHQFIQSIQGHKWPEASLHPFLALNQDAISRKYATITISVYDSLILGSPEGVIQNLGILLTDDKISSEHAELLNKLMDDVQEQEPEENIQNAKFVIASIINRIPDKFQSGSIEFVNSALVSSQDFRSRIGIDKITQLIDIAHPEDQKKIVTSLIDDAFGHEKFEVKLNSQQSPTLDEADSLATKISKLSLLVWKNHDLPEKAKQTLTDWLFSRKITLKTESTNLKFTILEDLMSQFEDQLIPAMGLKYTDLIISEFENGKESGLNVEVTLARCKKILSSEGQNGGENRIELWKQLSRLVAVKNEKAVLLARELAEEFKNFARDSQLTPFINKLSDRLVQDTNSEDMDEWKQCATTLITFVKLPNVTINPDLMDKIIILSDFYIQGEGSANIGIELLEIIISLNKEKSKTIIHNAISKIHEDLPKMSVIWLANNYSKVLGLKEEPALALELNKFFADIPTSQEKLKNYNFFLSHLSETSVSETAIQNHIELALAQIALQWPSFDKHGIHILRILSPLFKYSISLKANQSFQLFITAVMTNPKIIADVHGCFIGHWSPKITFATQVFFDSSIELATKNPTTANVGNILISCQELLGKMNISSDKNTVSLNTAALALWSNCPNESMQVIMSFKNAPSSDLVANLSEKTSLENELIYSNLGMSWSHISSIQVPTERVQTAILLLAKGKIKKPNVEDAALSLWFQSLNNNKFVSDDILTLIKVPTLQDEQLLRLWNIAFSSKEKLDKELFSEFLTYVLVKAGFDKTSNAIFEQRSNVEELFRDADERNRLSEKLVDSYLLCENIDRKRKIVQIIRDLRGSSKIVKLMDYLKSLNSDDVEIFLDAFPNEREVIGKIADAIKERDHIPENG